MLAQAVRSDLTRLFDDWRELGSKGTFRAHVRKADRSLLEVVDERPTLIAGIHREIRVALGIAVKPARKQRLPDEVVALHMGELGILYMQTAEPGDSLESFLERIRREHPTEEDLTRFLASRRPRA